MAVYRVHPTEQTSRLLILNWPRRFRPVENYARLRPAIEQHVLAVDGAVHGEIPLGRGLRAVPSLHEPGDKIVPGTGLDVDVIVKPPVVGLVRWDGVRYSHRPAGRLSTSARSCRAPPCFDCSSRYVYRVIWRTVIRRRKRRSISRLSGVSMYAK